MRIADCDTTYISIPHSYVSTDYVLTDFSCALRLAGKNVPKNRFLAKNGKFV